MTGCWIPPEHTEDGVRQLGAATVRRLNGSGRWNITLPDDWFETVFPDGIPKDEITLINKLEAYLSSLGGNVDA